MIETQFGFSSTAAEVVEGLDLTDKRVVVTGASSGIGVETARALASAGAEVTLAVRDVAAGEKTAAGIGGTVHTAKLDLTDLSSVEDFTRGWRGPLDVLIANAGVMATPERYTEQGWEWQFATNHLGHFALATGLHGALKAAGGARVVSVTSRGHMLSPVVFDDVHYAFRRYEPWGAYGQSKTANVLFAVEATRRWADDGITANAVMPGAILTNLQRHIGPSDVDPTITKSVEQGAATSVFVATSPLLRGIGGRYFDDCAETRTVDRRDEAPPMRGVARYALDPGNAARLWTYSETLLAKA
ncbi:NAD(P)-dependent dehydrogenase, short-chain alcohol dehydrogenase family [Lentzea xinjiangensis]|uniref:Probable oxidoreductase n=1 Tax=Lentzea xinjiangensis TaxID=402600 RepID=A0A1H9T4R0_9PSEU|nr:SDR family NAD(P)-dependent oxidoreductase [Lentzea xinjiangensis]SER92161.1 NAD(P)-dependent dehydrogenase, short-chain alcohol dehydrogenase family [Lentzea xinjiangensis]